MARDVGAAPTYPGLEPGAFADMLIPNIWLPCWDLNPDNPFKGNNGFRDRRSTIKLQGNIDGEI